MPDVVPATPDESGGFRNSHRRKRKSVRLPEMTAAPRPTNEAEVITWLVERVPELRPLLEQHLADMDDELLPYVVFESDFLRWFVNAVRGGDDEAARRFTEALEPLMTTTVKPPANDRVWNLTAVCFVEGLVMQGDDDVVKRARPWMGPRTWEDMQHQYWYRDGKLPQDVTP